MFITIKDKSTKPNKKDEVEIHESINSDCLYGRTGVIFYISQIFLNNHGLLQ